MKLFKYLLVVIAVLSIVTCKKVDDKKDIDIKKADAAETKVDVKNDATAERKEPPQKNSSLPYDLKESGLYVYADGPDIKKWVNQRCFEYTQKNYKYIPVIKQAEEKDIKEVWNYCRVLKSCITELGKPSLKELGYDRHREREIKPEDNRFGVPVSKEVKWWASERTKIGEYHYKFIDAGKFIKMTPQEFINNGIVIIGKNISRVLIKKPLHLPFYIQRGRIVVEYTYDYYGCDSKSWSKTYTAPIIANFRRVNLKENIFEFIQEEPLPNNASYLTDEEFLNLSEDIYQLIPRQLDKTIHPVTFNSYSPGYYLIEYYQGSRRVAWYGILLNGKGIEPPLWAPLEIKAP